MTDYLSSVTTNSAWNLQQLALCPSSRLSLRERRHRAVVERRTVLRWRWEMKTDEKTLRVAVPIAAMQCLAVFTFLLYSMNWKTQQSLRFYFTALLVGEKRDNISVSVFSCSFALFSFALCEESDRSRASTDVIILWIFLEQRSWCWCSEFSWTLESGACWCSDVWPLNVHVSRSIFRDCSQPRHTLRWRRFLFYAQRNDVELFATLGP